MKILRQYLTDPNIDFMRINPFVRKVNKISTTWENHNVPLRALYDYAMIVMLEGEMKFFYEEQQITLKVGEILIMPPFVQHKEFIEERHSAKYFVVNFDLFYSPERANWRMQDMYLNSCRAGIVKMNENPRYIVKDDNAGVFAAPAVMKVKNINVFLEILQKMYEKDISSMFQPLMTEDRMLLKAYLLEILSRLLRMEEIEEEKRYSAEINKFIEYVMENYPQHIDIDKKALELGFSPNFFQKIFKKETGVTPFAYLLQIRMNEAKILLSQGIQVKEVAKRVGYSDALYFGKVFKKQIGVSPAMYKDTIVDKTDYDVF